MAIACTPSRAEVVEDRRQCRQVERLALAAVLSEAARGARGAGSGERTAAACYSAG